MNELGTILSVWAHPDDETYLTAGLMAHAVRSGSRVACVTATRGEEGSWDEERWPTATMGKVREAELMRTLQLLGVTEHHLLDYYDGTCSSVDHEEGVGRTPVAAREQLAAAFELPPDLMDLKLKANSEHVSQVEGMMEAFGPDVFRESQKEEVFRLAAEKPAA